MTSLLGVKQSKGRHHDLIRMDDFASDVVELDEEKFAKEYKWPKIIINTNVTESKSVI